MSFMARELELGLVCVQPEPKCCLSDLGLWSLIPDTMDALNYAIRTHKLSPSNKWVIHGSSLGQQMGNV